MRGQMESSLGGGGEESSLWALMWLESRTFVNVWNVGRCVSGLETVSPKWAKVFLMIICFYCTPLVLLLRLISHLRISQSWHIPFFPTRHENWGPEKKTDSITKGIKDGTQAGVPKFATFHLLFLLHSPWSWVYPPPCLHMLEGLEMAIRHLALIHVASRPGCSLHSWWQMWTKLSSPVCFCHLTFFLHSRQVLLLFWKSKLHFIYDSLTT